MMRRVIAGMALLSLAACNGAPEQQPEPVAVQTVTVREQSVPNIIELPGRVEPVRTAEVRARVTGIVEARLYEEGTDVAAGQALFGIDPRELRASYAQTAATLQRAQATATNARAVVNRYQPLVAEQAISQQEYDAAVAAAREADANVAQIRAQLRSAELQLGYTTVRAPIAGRVGRALVTEGALVSQGEATLMTRIEQVSPVYVNFSQSASEVTRIQREVRNGTIELDGSGRIPVSLTLPDGTEFPQIGYINFLDFSVDPATGTVALRAEFINRNRTLLPGEFVRARIIAGHRAGGIMVPQRAVTLGENSASVMVIDADGNAELRPITVGAMSGQAWIVEDGLRVGDVVITSNLQRIRPGMPVARQQNAESRAESSGQDGNRAPPEGQSQQRQQQAN